MLRALMVVTMVAVLARGLSWGGSAWAAQSSAEVFPAPDTVFRMADGFELPARVWRPPAGVAARGVILALHGFTDSRDAWEYPAPGLAGAGWTVVAPDQRGFGATADRGVWAGQAAMIDDAAEVVRQLRARYQGQRLVMFGESMGGAVTMCLAVRAPGTADAYVLVSPAVWGRAQMAPAVRGALWAAFAVAPGWRLTGNEVPLEIAASDNREALLRLARDPLTLRGATVRMLRGLVDLMDSAQAAAAHLPGTTLVLNGRRDRVIPQAATAAMWGKLPGGVRRAMYLGGYHLLLRDLGRALVEADVMAWLDNPLVEADVMAWLDNPGGWLPSGADVNAAAWQADHAWEGEVSGVVPARVLEGAVGRSAWPY